MAASPRAVVSVRSLATDMSALRSILETYPLSKQAFEKAVVECACDVTEFKMMASRLLRGLYPFSSRQCHREHGLCRTSHVKGVPYYLCGHPIGSDIMAHHGPASKIQADIDAGLLSKDDSVHCVFFCAAGVAWMRYEAPDLQLTAGDVAALDALLMAAAAR